MSNHFQKLLLGLGCGGLLLGLALPPVALAEASDPVLAARADLVRGRDNDDGTAIDRAADEFRQLSTQSPGSPLLLAYYGSAVTLQAKHAWAPWNKMRYAENGLDALDKSLAMLQPEHEAQVARRHARGLVTRLVALTTFVGVPGMFHRLDDAKDVLQQASRVRPTAALRRVAGGFFVPGGLDRPARGKRDVEIEQLRQVLALGPQTEDAPKAAARLKELTLMNAAGSLPSGVALASAVAPAPVIACAACTSRTAAAPRALPRCAA
jgi:hypothetical protein